MRLDPSNPMKTALMSVLIGEVIVFGLAVPVMIMVSQVPALTASLAGGGAAVLALAATAMMRRPIGYPLGWLTQAAGLALGILTYGMLIMGVMFTALWVISFILGKRLEARQV